MHASASGTVNEADPEGTQLAASLWPLSASGPYNFKPLLASLRLQLNLVLESRDGSMSGIRSVSDDFQGPRKVALGRSLWIGRLNLVGMIMRDLSRRIWHI